MTHPSWNVSDAAKHLYISGCKKPFDDLELLFEDELGNYIMLYHLISKNPFVPGFNNGKINRTFSNMDLNLFNFFT